MAVVVLDTSVVIALLDADDTNHASAAAALSDIRLDDLALPASAYVEILVDPWRRRGTAVALVRRFVADLGIRVEPLTAEIAERAARLRAHHRVLRLPDALVLATAETLHASALTCDRAWVAVSRRARVV